VQQSLGSGWTEFVTNLAGTTQITVSDSLGSVGRFYRLKATYTP
jgi:hypothetical protein